MVKFLKKTKYFFSWPILTLLIVSGVAVFGVYFISAHPKDAGQYPPPTNFNPYYIANQIPDLDNCPAGPNAGVCYDALGFQLTDCRNASQDDKTFNLKGDVCDLCGNGKVDQNETCDYGISPRCTGPEGKCNGQPCASIGGDCTYCSLDCKLKTIFLHNNPPESNCKDGSDNDGDGYIDCQDPDCAGKTGPGNVTCCLNYTSSTNHTPKLDDSICPACWRCGLVSDTFYCSRQAICSACDVKDIPCHGKCGVAVCDQSDPNHSENGWVCRPDQSLCSTDYFCQKISQGMYNCM